MGTQYSSGDRWEGRSSRNARGRVADVPHPSGDGLYLRGAIRGVVWEILFHLQRMCVPLQCLHAPSHRTVPRHPHYFHWRCSPCCTGVPSVFPPVRLRIFTNNHISKGTYG